MNKKILALIALCTMLASCAPRGTPPRAEIGTNTILGACEGKGSPFDTDKNNPIGKPFTQWINTYHDAVDRIVNAHMNAIRGAVTQQPLKCTAGTLYALLQPTGDLRALAAILPPWNPEKQKSARFLENLSEADIGSVLLEHLRVYECALKERKKNLMQEVRTDLDNNPDVPKPVTMSQVLNQTSKEQKQIGDELVAARVALNRTLTIIGSLDRLRPISLELECIQRASLDLRNVLGLAADTTACLPRMWDTRGSLRDLSP